MIICVSRILFLTALLVSVNLCFAENLLGQVVRIVDGDTITVMDNAKVQHKIRLMGIDAPEKAQPFGRTAKLSLSSLLYGKQVAVEYYKLDRYGRTIGKVIVDGIDADLEQVKLGMAWHYKKYMKEQSDEDRALYTQAEAQARMKSRGLWHDAEPVPPWEWRKAHRGTQ